MLASRLRVHNVGDSLETHTSKRPVSGTIDKSSALQASYDAVPYHADAIGATHPDVLATAARLRGLTPADVERARVLEIGCSTGGNLLAIATSLPHGTFVGIDLAPRQIETARELARTLGLDRVRFEAMSVSDVNDSFGVFDYILVHGVYSWVPAEVQQALLRVCSRNLAPNGLAYVSYNTYPGWHFRGGVREMLLRHDQPSLPPATRIARAREFVAFLSKAAAPFDEAYAGALQFEAETLALATDTYVFHEEFEDVNQPLYFEQFAREAAAAGLQYVAEAQPTAKDAELTREVDRQIESWTHDRIGKEQYLDFVRNRSFRRSILCRAELQISTEPLTAAIPAMFVSGLCYPQAAGDGSGAEIFRTLDGSTATTKHPTVRAVFHVLADEWPRVLAFAELLEAVNARLSERGEAVCAGEALAEVILHATTARMLDLHRRRPSGATDLPDRPEVSPFARVQATHEHFVTSLAHKNIQLSDFDRLVLRKTDGTRDLAAMVTYVEQAIGSGELRVAPTTPSREDLVEIVEQVWTRFLRSRLVMG